MLLLSDDPLSDFLDGFDCLFLECMPAVSMGILLQGLLVPRSFVVGGCWLLALLHMEYVPPGRSVPGVMHLFFLRCRQCSAALRWCGRPIFQAAPF